MGVTDLKFRSPLAVETNSGRQWLAGHIDHPTQARCYLRLNEDLARRLIADTYSFLRSGFVDSNPLSGEEYASLKKTLATLEGYQGP